MRVDLELHLQETDEVMEGKFVYNTDLFDATTIDRMTEHFKTLLEGIAANPDMRLSELPLITEDERHRLLEDWNNTFVDYSGETCIHELFESQVEKTPDADVSYTVNGLTDLPQFEI